MQYIAPIYRSASKDGRIEKFFDLLIPIWFDRFPVKLLDNFDANERWDGANPDRIEWAKGIQTRRREYFDAAQNNVYLQGDEFLEHVVTTEEHEAIQRIQAEALLEEEQYRNQLELIAHKYGCCKGN
ncbi:hypothetical protein H0H81_005193 [Sphagnurus paluster]|uniref:Uncharacterized protein n=1 Tax=Sphagnurus paluster TaxID=117069 RepID=A0A9P7FRE4_9AGAR|nr:hypothetical protein H0H81_005193 [Sphagnurus paluster]